jgi:hypothetical protein
MASHGRKLGSVVARLPIVVSLAGSHLLLVRGAGWWWRGERRHHNGRGGVGHDAGWGRGAVRLGCGKVRLSGLGRRHVEAVTDERGVGKCRASKHYHIFLPQQTHPSKATAKLVFRINT